MLLTFLKKFLIFCIGTPVVASTIFVTDASSVYGEGCLGTALLQAVDGDTIDCLPIAGQTIGLETPLPAIAYISTSANPSLTILGRGVIIDGGGVHAGFSLAQGAATITDFTLQNGLSKGGAGGFGYTGGGGGTGGGGALYVHSGTTLTVSTLNLNNNQAIGGAGGAGNATGGSGGGGGGFGGGSGGHASDTGARAGSAGGGGGNSGGSAGGRDGGVGTPNSFSNFAGAGAGGEIPGNSGAKSGGTVAATSITPAQLGGIAGIGSATNGAGAGGGAGSGGSGLSGSNSIDQGGSGRGGAAGLGVGVDHTYGAGGGGGGGNGGGAGYGVSGGGGGLNGSGGAGGLWGGGGGASGTSGGNGGFGAGGGGGNSGGVDLYGLGGAGGSANGEPAGGGGGSGLGGALFIQQGGLLIMQDGVSFLGNSTMIGTGGIAVGLGMSGADGSSLGQDIFIQSGGSLTFAVNDTLILTNPIEGAGFLSQATGPGVIKAGTGTVSLTGNNTYRGGTQVQAGILNLNGSVIQDMYIQSGGTLSGNGTVGGNIYNYGIISPGNSIGSILTTDLYLYPTSMYQVELNSAGDSDSIIASGLAQVSGSVVVHPDDVAFTAPLTYTIVSTGAGVTGVFSSVTSTIPALMSLIYNPSSIQLVYLPINALGLTGNALRAANCFATLSGADPSIINNALLAVSFDSIHCAFQQMSPAQFSAPTEVQLLDALLVRTTYTKHLHKICFNQDCTGERPFSFWFDGIAQWQHQSKLYGYTDTTAGATIGVDYGTRHGIIGLAFSTTYDRMHWQYFGGKANLNSYYGGLYGRYHLNNFYLDGAMIGAANRYRTTRQLKFGSINRAAYAQHQGSQWLTHLGLGYEICPSALRVTPYINLDYVIQHEQSYSESGAGSLDLHVKHKGAMLFQGEAGVLFRRTYEIGNGIFIPMLTLAYINQTPCSSKHYGANFTDSCCVFTGAGGHYERNLFVPRLAFTYQDLACKTSVSLYYDGQVGSHYWAQDLVLDLTFRY